MLKGLDLLVFELPVICNVFFINVSVSWCLNLANRLRTISSKSFGFGEGFPFVNEDMSVLWLYIFYIIMQKYSQVNQRNYQNWDF